MSGSLLESKSVLRQFKKTKSMKDHESVLEQYVGTFAKLDEMVADEAWDPLAPDLDTGEVDLIGRKIWQPFRFTSPRECLDLIYGKLPARLPPLFERLVLSYRWIESTCRPIASSAIHRGQI